MSDDEKLKLAAEILLHELEERFLEVVLTPAPDERHQGHMIRRTINTNPEWYSYLWDVHGRISRRVVINTLTRIAKTGFLKKQNKYDSYLEETLEETKRKIKL